MKRILLAVSALALSVPAFSAPLCSSVGGTTIGNQTTISLANLVASGATGCVVGDKIFSNFSYASSSTSSSAVNVSITNVGGLNVLYQVLFNPDVAWTDLALGYTVTVDQTVSPNNRIFQVKDQENTVRADGNVPLNPDNSVTNITHNPGGPLTLLGVSNAAETASTPLFSTLSVANTYQYLANGNPGAGGAPGKLLSLENDFTQGNVPEPASLVLMGAGLVGLAAIRRKKA